jgi:hypothetical protein
MINRWGLFYEFIIPTKEKSRRIGHNPRVFAGVPARALPAVLNSKKAYSGAFQAIRMGAASPFADDEGNGKTLHPVSVGI